MNVFRPLSASMLLALAACSQNAVNTMNSQSKPATAPATEPAPSASANLASNPLMQPSTLPYLLPPFDKIRNEHFGPAIEAGMAEEKREIDVIAAQSGSTHVREHCRRDGTHRAVAGTRASSVFYNLTSSNTNPDLEKLQAELAPKLSAHSDSIYLNPATVRAHQPAA